MSAGIVAMIAWLAVIALLGFLAGMAFGRVYSGRQAQNGRFDV